MCMQISQILHKKIIPSVLSPPSKKAKSKCNPRGLNVSLLGELGCMHSNTKRQHQNSLRDELAVGFWARLT